MSRIPLSTFAPINTPKAVTNLVSYLSVLKPRERYESQDCLASITTDELRRLFCKEVIEKEIYPDTDLPIASIMEQDKAQMAAKDSGKQKIESKTKKKKNKKQIKKEPTQENRIEQHFNASSRQYSERGNRFVYEEKMRDREALLARLKRSSSKVSTEDFIIARDVKASRFSVVQGCIYYLSYKLESVRIPSIPDSVLATIERTFTIKKDSGKYYKTGSHFVFEPATDLSVFLNEATRANLKLGNSVKRIDKPVEYEGIFYLPWKYVAFREGYLFLTHPNAKGRDTINPFRFDHHLIHKSYGDFMPYIEKNAPKLLVEGHNGRITQLLNFPKLAKIFPHLTSYATLENNEISIGRMRPVVNRAYSIDEFRNARFINKSQYLAYLCKMQLPSYKIYYLLENAVHESSDLSRDEFGYLFAIRAFGMTLTLLYENVIDESRSSLVFNIYRSEFEDAVKFIARFLASDEENKRLKLAHERVHFNRYVKSYGRISHTTYEEWRSRINYFIRYGII